MSDLLNQASLVMVPSGYKEDTVYSVVPTDGSGDMTLTRASNGTRVNSAGLVEVCPWNLLSNSEEFTTGNGWFPNVTGSSTASQTSDYGVAPNGTTTADRIQLALNGSSFADWVVVPTTGIIVGQVYTYSIYIKSLSGTKIIKFFNDNSVNVLKTITTEWARYEYTWTASSATIYPRFLIDSGGETSTSADLLAWGYQINIGSTAKPYFPTTDRLNVPRLTYQNGGGGCPSLLLEKQSTNVATQSTVTSFGSGTNDWLNGANSPASINQTTGIDGTQNGTKYTKTAGQTTNDFFYKNQVPVTSGTTYTVSGYIKLGTASNAVVVINNTSAWNSVPNGNIVCSTANGFSTTAWKRFELTITGPSTNQINIHYGYHNETGVTAQADGTFFLDGFQVEASSYATSLIPTTSSSATRVADACYKTGISSLIGQTEGTLFVDSIITHSAPSNEYFIQVSESGSNRFFIYREGTTNRIGCFALVGSTQIYTQLTSGSVTSRVKAAFAYKSGSFAFYVNGTQIGTSTATFSTPPTMDKFYIDSNEGTENGYYNYNQAVLFPTRLTNAELASLTTL